MCLLLELIAAALVAFLFFAYAAVALIFMLIVGAVLGVLWVVGCVAERLKRRAEHSKPKV